MRSRTIFPKATTTVALATAIALAIFVLGGDTAAQAQSTSGALSVEGESMSFSPSGAGQVGNYSQAGGGQALDLWSPATATKSVTLASSTNSVTVRAWRYCGNNAPTLTVKLNGTSVGSANVSAQSGPADYTIPISPSVSGRQKVDVVWSNDNNSGCDQNVFIDKLTFGGPSGSSPPPPPPSPPPPSGSTSLGVFAGQDGGDGGAWASSTLTAVHAFENTIGATTAAKKPKMAHMFYPFYLSGSCGALPPGPGTAVKEGYAPLFTVEFTNYGSGSAPAMTYANINNGTFDSCLHSYASKMKALGGKVYLRMFHEMNGNWYPWRAAGHEQEHVAAWRHIHDLFASDGATNVKMVWCPNTRYSGDAGPYANYYPGDAYVDYVCLDGYNWASAHGVSWQSFDQIFRPSYAEITALSAKPVIIGEYASTEGSSGQKAQWIADAQNIVKANYPRIRVLNWFNQNDGSALWVVDSSASSLSAYQTYDNGASYQASFP